MTKVRSKDAQTIAIKEGGVKKSARIMKANDRRQFKNEVNDISFVHVIVECALKFVLRILYHNFLSSFIGLSS